MAIPILNERDRRGTKIRTQNADWTIVGRVVCDRVGVVRTLQIVVVGVRLLTAAAATQPAGYSYQRLATYVTDASGVVTQIGSTDTIGTDKETDSAASIQVIVSGTQNIDIMVSAAFPTDWSCYVTDIVVDQFQVG